MEKEVARDDERGGEVEEARGRLVFITTSA